MSLNLEKLNRELERLKFDTTDMIESKQEQMQKSFSNELSTIKTRYEEAVDLVTEASRNLG